MKARLRARLFYWVRRQDMAKAKGKSKGGKPSSKPKTGGTKGVNVAGIRLTITRMVAHQASDMVKAAIEEAKKGQSGALKYLFEMIGLYPATLEAEQTEKREMSLAEYLCRQLGLPMHPVEEQAGESAESEPIHEDDAVE